MTKRPSPEHKAKVRHTGLDEEHLVAMGEVAYWSARLERTLAFVVMALVSDDDGETNEIGIVATRGLPFARLLELGGHLVELRRFDGQVRDLFKRLSAEAKTAMESRNHLLHGDWTTPQQGPATASLTRTKRTIDREFTVEQVQDVAFDLAVLANRLFVLFLVVEGCIDYEESTPPDDFETR
ncbi:hypothetical protein [Curtobacterium flaccumfaciens]|uniref:hypothetical protein n=1 Tax=Curtobacterium flaccumfaciens TaxID=2035 RepID=UPI0016038E5B|nr:hypothetical protein [Curtobacterium flaccumfaciens]MBB1198663.1 hypothetical protein [Curtobacterium flaccumfaciens]